MIKMYRWYGKFKPDGINRPHGISNKECLVRNFVALMEKKDRITRENKLAEQFFNFPSHDLIYKYYGNTQKKIINEPKPLGKKSKDGSQPKLMDGDSDENLVGSSNSKATLSHCCSHKMVASDDQLLEELMDKNHGLNTFTIDCLLGLTINSNSDLSKQRHKLKPS
jgi:hypothetical protein